MTLVTAGRVGKPHGRDGSFYVDRAAHPLPHGITIVLLGSRHTLTQRGGTDDRPLIRLSGVEDPRSLRGELLLVEDELGSDEWLASDLLERPVPGPGRGGRGLDGPSCSVLELEDGSLVPFVSDAIHSVREGVIEVNEDFVG